MRNQIHVVESSRASTFRSRKIGRMRAAPQSATLKAFKALLVSLTRSLWILALRLRSRAAPDTRRRYPRSATFSGSYGLSATILAGRS